MTSSSTRNTEPRGSRVADIYGTTEISERHRHRYEVNTAYKNRLEQHGMRFSGSSPDGILPEIVEYEDHPWFVGVQFHPESIASEHGHDILANFLSLAGLSPKRRNVAAKRVAA